MIRRVLIFTLIGLAIFAAVGVVFWRVNLRERSRYTDADKINTPVASAPIRQILWQPADLVRDAGDASADQYEPRASADGQILIFVRGRAGKNADLFQSKRTPDGWSAPQPVTAINTTSDELGPELSADGRTLYFYSDRQGSLGGYDLWLSRRDDAGGDWKEPVNLGPSINTEFNEYGPALTPDAKRLFFSSNRPRPGDPAQLAQRDPWPATLRELRTRHDYDLYVCDILTSGLEGAAAVRELNTQHDEGAPAVSPAGDFLYFASDRPGSLGGFDVFRSRVLRGRIQPPENLGSAINTASNDLDPSLSIDGFRIFFSSDRRLADQPPADSTATSAAPEPARYALYSSSSREVFIETDPLHAASMLARLWAVAWPWLLALLAALILAILFYLAMRDAAIRHRLAQLSLMAKCLLISLLIHAAILSAFAVWRVGTAIGDMLRDGGRGQGTQVALGASDGSGSLESQIRGSLTTVGIEAPAIEASRPETTPLEIQAPAIQVATSPANLTFTLTQTSYSPTDAPAPATAAPAPTAPTLTEATLAARTPSSESAAAPSSESRAEIAPDAAGLRTSAAAVKVPSSSVGAVALNPSAAPVTTPSGSAGFIVPESGSTVAAGTPASASPANSVAPATNTTLAHRLPESQAGSAAASEPALGSVASSTLPSSSQPSLPSSAGGSAQVALTPSAATVGAIASGSPRIAAQEAPTTGSSAAAVPHTAPVLPALAGAARSARLPGTSPAPAATASTESPSGSDASAPTALGGSSRPSLALGSPSVASSVHLAPTAAGSGSIAPSAAGSSLIAPTEAPAGAGLAAAPAKGSDLKGLPSITFKSNLPAVPAEPPKAAPKPDTFAQRAPEIREKVLKQTGGSPETERAVAAALDWFQRHQSADGHWSGQHFDERCNDCSSAAEIDADAAMTGITLLCYLGSGHTHKAEGPHRDSVKKALTWIVNRTDSSGDLRQGETMYSQTIAAIALCEAFAMTRDPWLETPARRAITFVARGSQGGRGADTSVLGWQIMAVKSAQRAGFDVPTTAFDAARRWLDQTASPNAPGRYAYRQGESPSPAATAEAMFVQQLLGHSRDEPRMRQSADFILTAPPAWRREAPTFYWYYATLAIFQQQGEHWKTWNEGIARELLRNQRQDGGAKGSWDPQDQWSRLGGRVYQTAVCTLSLEVYYRYRLAEPQPAP